MEDPASSDAPVTPVCVTVQEKVVPVTLPARATEVVAPEQIVCDAGVAVTFGVGFTVMVTVTGLPEQPPADGVIVYTTVPAVLPVADNVCAMEEPLPAEAPDAPLCVTVQENVVPATLLLNVTDVAVPEQIVWVAGVAVTTGIGFTVMVTVTGVPVHPLADGVIEYTAVPAVVPVAVSVCAIDVPLPADAPDTPVCVTVQEKVVPVVKLDKEMPVVPPEQIVCDEGVAVANGIGFTVMVTVTGVPEQPFANGVMV